MKKISILQLIERIFLILLVTFLIWSCGGSKDSGPQPPVLKVGEARLAVRGGNIWYKVTGTGTATPVVLLHGGPGMSSFYLKPLEDLGNDRQVIRYDQLGGGKSDVITDTTLFIFDHFVKELDSLRAHLGLQKWHLYGHSWGTIIAIEYYRAYPDKVASLTFGSLCFDIPAWEQSTRQLLKTLSDSLQDAVRKAELTGRYDVPAYQEAMNQFYSLYVCRRPVQADLDSMLATFNTGIYGYMWGPSEFSITGTLKNYNTSSFLPQIKVPVLFTVGEFDEISPESVKSISDKVPGARYVMFPGSSHMTSWDARDENLKVVREFLQHADSLNNKSNSR
jgi:proline iminopeptidase